MSPDKNIAKALSGQYEILSVIGKGGMATVYKAVQKKLHRQVALKIVHQNLVHDEEFVKRFIREAQICASLNHPNIITVFDVGSVGTVHYMAMELLEGQSLRSLIKSKNKLSNTETAKYGTTIADALGYIHKMNLIHRDIKSSNVFITNGGRAVLMDFGIVYSEGGEALSLDGAILGTPEYMSPEQAEGKVKLDGRTDIYSLGIVMFECLTGEVPFRSENYISTLHQVIHDDIPSISTVYSRIPKWLSSIVASCLVKDRSKRMQSGYELAQALQNKTNVRIQTGKRDYKTRKISRRQVEKSRDISPAEDRAPVKSGNNSLILVSIIVATIIVIILLYLNFGVSRQSGGGGGGAELTPVETPIDDVESIQDTDEPVGVEETLIQEDDEVIGMQEAQLEEEDNGAEQESLEQDRQEAIRLENERKEQARIERERIEQQRLEQDRQEAIRLENERREQARIERERIERERRAEQLRLEGLALVESELSGLGIDMILLESSSLGNYYLAKSEVSQKLWVDIMGDNPSVSTGDMLPVENVSYNEVQLFIRELNKRTGATFRLPSEREWEFAFKGGGQSENYIYSGSNILSEVAWYQGNSGNTPHNIMRKNPNELGFYDMSGNVWEWTSTVVNGQKVLKGGSWFGLKDSCTGSKRMLLDTGTKDFTAGFRLCRN